MERVGPWTPDRWLLVFAIAGAAVGTGLTLVAIFAIQAVCVLCTPAFAIDLVILASVHVGLR